ncbi:hypothetical protein POR1_72 [Pseudomonas phage POR1]|uniref:Uncharacterized protein n=1 Tax=Pseudomonas phage POR1 TaxID=1718594 RepID=A0A0N9SIE1_9CAUD|nr:hypothetical protein POR1_72 [Pseudomonas phage POR1]
MNKAKILGVLASLGLGGLLTYGASGSRSSASRTKSRSYGSFARKTAEQNAADFKAAGIKRLRRQQRNVLLSEKGAFDDSRLTYPLTGARSARRLLGSMDAASRGTSAAMRFSNMNGVRVFADGKEIVGFG